MHGTGLWVAGPQSRGMSDEHAAAGRNIELSLARVTRVKRPCWHPHRSSEGLATFYLIIFFKTKMASHAAVVN